MDEGETNTQLIELVAQLKKEYVFSCPRIGL